MASSNSRAVIHFLAHAFVCVVTSVYSIHLYILFMHPTATRDAQYAITFMLSGAWGWVVGALFYFGRLKLEAKAPGRTNRFLTAMAAYAFILTVVAVSYEATVAPPGMAAAPLYLLVRMPLLFVMSLLGLAILPMAPGMWLAGAGAMAMPALILTGLYLFRKYRPARPGA